MSQGPTKEALPGRRTLLEKKKAELVKRTPQKYSPRLQRAAHREADPSRTHTLTRAARWPRRRLLRILWERVLSSRRAKLAGSAPLPSPALRRSRSPPRPVLKLCERLSIPSPPALGDLHPEAGPRKPPGTSPRSASPARPNRPSRPRPPPSGPSSARSPPRPRDPSPRRRAGGPGRPSHRD